MHKKTFDQMAQEQVDFLNERLAGVDQGELWKFWGLLQYWLVLGEK
ncbi:hypothetical protein [Enterococcus sp. DIV0187]